MTPYAITAGTIISSQPAKWFGLTNGPANRPSLAIAGQTHSTCPFPAASCMNAISAKTSPLPTSVRKSTRNARARPSSPAGVSCQG